MQFFWMPDLKSQAFRKFSTFSYFHKVFNCLQVDCKFFGRNTIFSFSSIPNSVVIIVRALLGAVIEGRNRHRDNLLVWTGLFRCSHTTNDDLRARLA